MAIEITPTVNIGNESCFCGMPGIKNKLLERYSPLKATLMLGLIMLCGICPYNRWKHKGQFRRRPPGDQALPEAS